MIVQIVLENMKLCVVFFPQIEEERDHYFNEATDQARKVESLLEEIRKEEATNFSFRKEMSDIDNQLKQQQNLYQAVRNDKTVLQVFIIFPLVRMIFSSI